jgi:membrane protein DedA with SNARE-associated domain
VPELSDVWPLFVNFALLVLAGIGFPVPEEIPTVALGIWVAKPDTKETLGVLRWIALPVAWTGVILSDVLLYWIGRLWGRKLLQHRWLAKLAPEDKRAKIERNFQQYGVKILLFIRWVPAIRSPMFITAGISRIPFVSFLIADAIAAIAGHSLLFFLAWWFGDTFQDLINRFTGLEEKIKPLIILIVILGVVIYFVIHFYRRPFSVGDPKEVPLIGDRVAAKFEARESHAEELAKQLKQAATANDGIQRPASSIQRHSDKAG